MSNLRTLEANRVSTHHPFLTWGGGAATARCACGWEASVTWRKGRRATLSMLASAVWANHVAQQVRQRRWERG